VASISRECANSPEKTLAIPVPAGKSLPDFPASGIDLSVKGGVLLGINPSCFDLGRA
jgi:hypothetical protein